VLVVLVDRTDFERHVDREPLGAAAADLAGLDEQGLRARLEDLAPPRGGAPA
jgi:hypothetical protein